MPKKQLNEVYLLRGLASLMVCLYHLVVGNTDLFSSSNGLKKIFSFGYLGVETFFILSGYVICFSLPQDFSYRDVKTFFVKRISRIEPPYVVSILLVVGLNLISHKITGTENHFDFLTVVGHLAYLNNFNPSSYLNVVYWTLGIEFQFYIIISLMFPLLKNSNVLVIGLAVLFIALACLPLVGSAALIIPFLSYFTLGIVLFFYKLKKQLSLSVFMILSALCLIQIAIFQGREGCLAAALTVGLLLFWKKTNAVIKFFSMISYSLYLIHVPVGGKVINLGMRYTGSGYTRYALVLIALSVSVGFAYLFYKWVELPAFNFSKRILYQKRPAVVDMPNQLNDLVKPETTAANKSF